MAKVLVWSRPPFWVGNNGCGDNLYPDWDHRLGVVLEGFAQF